MIFNLEQFNGKYGVYSYVKTIETLQSKQKENINILFHATNKCYLYPEGVCFQISEEENEKLNYLWEGDVLQLIGDHKFYLFYSGESDDNSIMITGKCNSNCIMCPASELVRKKANMMNIDELLDVARHIPEDATHLTITGGEPFLLGKDIFLLLNFLKCNRSNIPYLILTNGRVFADAEYCHLLKETLPKKTTLGIPIHGFNSSTHDFVTQSLGSFEQTVKGIQNLVKLNIDIELRFVLSKLTMDNITQMAEYIVENLRGISCVKIMGLEMLGNAAVNKEQVWIDYPTAFEVAKQEIDLLVRNGIDVQLYNFPLCAVNKEYWGLYRKSISGYKVKYKDECKACIEKETCGGIFSGTIRLVENIMPIVEG